MTFLYPADKLTELSETLIGKRGAEVEETIIQFYEKYDLESPGVEPAGFARVVIG